MRFYTGADGFQQLWIKDDELDRMVETELARAELLATEATPVVNVERFLQLHLGVELDVGATLEPNVLGLTELRVGQPARVLINRNLSDSAVEEDPRTGNLGRWRATLAHEAMHVLLHGLLFELNANQETLFDGAARPAPLMRCLKRDVGFGTVSHDPREWQANKGMAAILMPRTLFGALARRERHAGRDEGSLTAWLATTFAVSRQAASIRLGTLGFLEPDGRYVAGLSL